MSTARALVLYGSETGNASSLAGEIAREVLRRPHVACEVAPMNSWVDLVTRPESVAADRIVIFVASTTGQGICPRNMNVFWRALMPAALPNNLLSKLKFTVFGLGDSRYPQFNFAARKLHRRLLQLGASEFYRLGLGDDQHDFGFEGEFDPWLEGLMAAIDEVVPLPDGAELLPAGAKPAAKYVITMSLKSQPAEGPEPFAPCFYLTENAKTDDGRHLAPRPHDEPLPAGGVEVHPIVNRRTPRGYAAVISNCRVTAPSHFQDVRHLKLRLSPEDSSDLASSFPPGAAVSLYPCNADALVFQLLEELRLRPDTSIGISLSRTAVERRSPFPAQPSSMSLYELFKYFRDLTKVPDRHFFSYLSHFCSDEEQKEKLCEIADRTPEAKDFFYEYCKLEKRNFSEILMDFPAARPPLDHLLSMIPVIQPRKYSVASECDWYFKKTWWTPSAARLIAGLSFLGFHSAPLAFFMKRRHLFGNARNKQMQENVFAQIAEASLANHLDDAHDDFYNDIEKDDERGRHLDLCVGVVEYKTKLQRDIVGLCGDFVRNLTVGDKIPIGLDDLMPATPLPDLEDLSAPFVFLGPGTGVAPVRAMLQRRYLRVLQKSRESPDALKAILASRPRDLLFLGFRHKAADFLFSEEWQEERWDIPEAGELSAETRRWLNIHVAFSRDHEDRKVYVQDLMEENAKQVLDALLHPKGAIVICGRSHPMPSQVDDILLDIFQKQGVMAKDKADRFLKTLKAQRRHVCDTWG